MQRMFCVRFMMYTVFHPSRTVGETISCYSICTQPLLNVS